MNKETFTRSIAAVRDCEQARLDAAVRAGLRRAKSERPDSRKLAVLAAACALTLTVCVLVTMRPVQAAARTYCLNRSSLVRDKEEVLSGYAQNIANIIFSFAERGIFERGGK